MNRANPFIRRLHPILAIVTLMAFPNSGAPFSFNQTPQHPYPQQLNPWMYNQYHQPYQNLQIPFHTSSQPLSKNDQYFQKPAQALPKGKVPSTAPQKHVRDSQHSNDNKASDRRVIQLSKTFHVSEPQASSPPASSQFRTSLDPATSAWGPAMDKRQQHPRGLRRGQRRKLIPMKDLLGNRTQSTDGKKERLRTSLSLTQRRSKLAPKPTNISPKRRTLVGQTTPKHPRNGNRGSHIPLPVNPYLRPSPERSRRVHPPTERPTSILGKKGRALQKRDGRNPYPSGPWKDANAQYLKALELQTESPKYKDLEDIPDEHDHHHHHYSDDPNDDVYYPCDDDHEEEEEDYTTGDEYNYYPESKVKDTKGSSQNQNQNASGGARKPTSTPDIVPPVSPPVIIPPRLHNPIPLGCLLTFPIFHPFFPRNHLGCFLSIPGTPNLI